MCCGFGQINHHRGVVTQIDEQVLRGFTLVAITHHRDAVGTTDAQTARIETTLRIRGGARSGAGRGVHDDHIGADQSFALFCRHATIHLGRSVLREGWRRGGQHQCQRTGKVFDPHLLFHGMNPC
ncbi:MAG: hypothetical protein BWZ07_01953 [Alphaproteobacteria bacterium ADurb.BinA280]|nr:MAG: hypothetical protein BWZ07_01953 [Alphaproteobacteria bacterium ADurb.BinA280]